MSISLLNCENKLVILSFLRRPSKPDFDQILKSGDKYKLKPQMNRYGVKAYAHGI